jgi:hypothetical protein
MSLFWSALILMRSIAEKVYTAHSFMVKHNDSLLRPP